MPGASYDLLIDQGKTFSREFQLKDALGAVIDITGWTARGQIRKTYSDVAKLADFVCTLTTPLQGKFTISLTDIVSAGIPVDPAAGASKRATKWVYDIEAVRGDGTVVAIAEGLARIWPEVTR
jgi:hypothetical protein